MIHLLLSCRLHDWRCLCLALHPPGDLGERGSCLWKALTLLVFVCMLLSRLPFASARTDIVLPGLLLALLRLRVLIGFQGQNLRSDQIRSDPLLLFLNALQRLSDKLQVLDLLLNRGLSAVMLLLLPVVLFHRVHLHLVLLRQIILTEMVVNFFLQLIFCHLFLPLANVSRRVHYVLIELEQ